MSMDYTIPRSPANKAVKEIMDRLRGLTDILGNKLNAHVDMGLKFLRSLENPNPDNLPAIYGWYRETNRGRPYINDSQNHQASTQMLMGEIGVTLSLFFVIYDFREDHDFGIQDKLEDYVQYNLMKLEKGSGFVPTQGLWKWDPNQAVIPVRLTNQLEGITSIPIQPPFYMARADLKLIVYNTTANYG